MKKLYFSNSEYNQGFFWVSETPKTIKIEWVKNFNCDGSELDQNIRHKKLTVKKDNGRSRHCLKDYEAGDKEFLIYPDRSGQPFYLRPATIEDINREIKDCEGWGVGSQYYSDLLKYVDNF